MSTPTPPCPPHKGVTAVWRGGLGHCRSGRGGLRWRAAAARRGRLSRQPHFLEAGLVHSSWAGQPAPLRAGPRLSSEPVFPQALGPGGGSAFGLGLPLPTWSTSLTSPGSLRQCLQQPFLGSWPPVCAGAPGRAGTGGTQHPGPLPVRGAGRQQGRPEEGSRALCPQGAGPGPGAVRGLLRVWSCSVLSSCFDLEQLATGRWARRT